LAVLNIFFPSHLANENLQNHFIFEFPNFNFDFWRYFANKKKAAWVLIRSFATMTQAAANCSREEEGPLIS
jgi:hypothetical protein